MPASRIVRILLLATAAGCIAAQAQTTLYRWVDKDGRVHYTDSPPPADAKGATQKRFGGDAEGQQLPYATRTAVSRNPVMLWVVPGCEPCDRGLQLLSNRGVPFSVRDANANAETQEALKKVTGDLNVPLLEVGEKRIKGFEEGQWNAALDAAGYPRDRPYGVPPTRPAVANLPAAGASAPAEAPPATR